MQSDRMTVCRDDSIQMSALFYQVLQAMASHSIIVDFARSTMPVIGLDVKSCTQNAFWIASTARYRRTVADGSSIQNEDVNSVSNRLE